MRVAAFAALSLLAWPAIAGVPTFDHWPPQLEDGKDLVIKTGISNATNVYRPTLHWRRVGTVPFTEVPLKPGGPALFQATIPAFQIGGADVEYYLQAFDESDVEATRSRWPAGREYERLRTRAEDRRVRGTDPAPPAASSDFAISLMGGALMPGSITIGDAVPDTSLGFIGRFAVDAMVARKLSVGAFVSIASIAFQELDVNARSLGLGTTLKAHFAVGPAQIRPGISLAFQLSDVDQGDAVTGVGVGALLETAVPVARRINLMLQVGFLTQPAGGNSAADVTWGPIFYFATGLEFGM